MTDEEKRERFIDEMMIGDPVQQAMSVFLENDVDEHIVKTLRKCIKDDGIPIEHVLSALLKITFASIFIPYGKVTNVAQRVSVVIALEALAKNAFGNVSFNYLNDTTSFDDKTRKGEK